MAERISIIASGVAIVMLFTVGLPIWIAICKLGAL